MQKIYFVFGPEGSFFFAGPKGFESAGLPTGVETRIATAASVVNIAVGDRGESNDPIVFIAFTKKEDSRVWTWWSASFEQAVKETTSFAALNPFRVGQFFILFANNTAVFQVPLSYRSKLESALKKHGITCTALTSQQAEKKVKMPNAAKRPDFAKRLLKDVTGPVVGAVVSGIASALIGAVACTVM
ncbi:hypothetical protein B0A48_07906 [Cryoendolithus antarcticus]|uniref:Uncharacterized protein n=1 Tax=Cryoendolithus antarcticus TaxID=1507870 RepID=A0A1V8T0Q3_9PEZI|nr:hypothetical protein B0A48_07906 [Cryoendolithus antarcticus]